MNEIPMSEMILDEISIPQFKAIKYEMQSFFQAAFALIKPFFHIKNRYITLKITSFISNKMLNFI